LTYDDARRRATRIARAVATGHMPPWLPDQGTPAFVGERRLSVDQIAMLKRWADEGAPEGPRAALPAAPSFPSSWQLGQPDLVVTAPRPYLLASGTTEVFRNLVIAVPLSGTRHIRAVEFQPGSAPVHHAVIHIDRTTASRRRDGSDGQPGFEGMGGREAQDPDGHFLGWAPGRGPIVAPDGMPWRIDRGTDLVVELHLVPGDAAQAVQPTIGLYFADGPAVQVPLMLKMGSKAIDIPAGDPNYVVEDRMTLAADVDLLSIYPHAHYLGKTMAVTATLPDGSTRSLLTIRRWSFRWQQEYRYRTPIALPRGTTITMRFSYDNSAANEDNPHSPPRQVRCGQQSTDEMGNLGLQVLPKSRVDRMALAREAATRDAAANLEGARMLVRNNPANAENQAFLGGSYVDAGRPADALPHLDLAIRLDPGSVNARNELGGALLALGRPTEALTAFQQAATLAPGDDRIHFNVAMVLARLGRHAEAIRAFDRTIQLNPDHADAHGELGVILFVMNRRADAIARLSRAVELAPDSARLQSDLGGVLASVGRRAEALQHVRRALELDPTYGPAQENLARLGR
jgi:Tfp pilus assembly protein PilF